MFEVKIQIQFGQFNWSFCMFYLDTDWHETDWRYVAVLEAIYIRVKYYFIFL